MAAIQNINISLPGEELHLPNPVPFSLALSGGNNKPPTISRITVLIGRISSANIRNIIECDPSHKLQKIMTDMLDTFIARQFLNNKMDIAHILCPFIWRFLNEFDPEYKKKIPVIWLTFGPRSCGLFRNIISQQSNNTFQNIYSTNVSASLLYTDPRAVTIWNDAFNTIRRTYSPDELRTLCGIIKSILTATVAGGKRNKKTKKNRK